MKISKPKKRNPTEKTRGCISFTSIPITLRLEGGKGIEWNRMEKKNIYIYILRIFSHFPYLEV
jgi:hypothetical protein